MTMIVIARQDSQEKRANMTSTNAYDGFIDVMPPVPTVLTLVVHINAIVNSDTLKTQVSWVFL